MSHENRPKRTPQERLRDADRLYSSLRSWEKGWVDRQPFLESRGYMLRPRYRPGWVPSWRGTDEYPWLFEDSISLPVREYLTDATRIADGMLVYIKLVKTGDNESRIATMLSDPSFRDDPDNHSVPILDTFQDAKDKSISYLVMPFLRLIDEPPFALVGEVVDFVDQILKGLQFLHKHGVAHRDCTYKNLMMDASEMFPQGFHPVDQTSLPDGETTAPYYRRTDVHVKYYFVDYGISVHIPRDAQSKLVVGVNGRDQEVPELSDDTPYDPFKVDVFIIGNVFRHEFYEKYSNLDFLLPAMKSMLQNDPARRPSASEIVAQWQTIRDTISPVHLIWRLRPRAEGFVLTAINDTVSLVGSAAYFGRLLFSWATDIQ
ncbi:uncharacterized protein LAESUDRAFT_690312 [Laetiporus sulphureus 93-53]|uniref:Protein kinase domain-containing protein n=1 Tax=Laetiporus sulphureus 93-53 TaxID=1314785 RepID=A0A165IIG1_9APHY|nr:uncharacterized protein LAESUDRAFT_690312 [Laetiporus sulphureus 93-53]KZT13120.1 hypothetical protein LAESUDRAFT_690312 [Laetiporus sulphureus 93-53]